ncbi:hypothetical protein D3C73_184880 [compost metagenome]
MFYATATNKNGVHVVIENLPTSRHLAVKAAETHAKKNELKLDGVYLDKKKQKQNNTLTKFSKERRKTLGHR